MKISVNQQRTFDIRVDELNSSTDDKEDQKKMHLTAFRLLIKQGNDGLYPERIVSVDGNDTLDSAAIPRPF